VRTVIDNTNRKATTTADAVTSPRIIRRWPDEIGKRLAPEASLDGMVGS